MTIRLFLRDRLNLRWVLGGLLMWVAVGGFGMNSEARAQAPVVSSFTPAEGATDITIDTPIIITFDRDMDTTVAVLSSLNLTMSPASIPFIQGTWADDKRTLTLKPSFGNWPLNITIQWTLNPAGSLAFLQIKSAAGVALGTVSGSFSTGLGAPAMGSVSPATDDEAVATNSLVTFRFTQPMKKIELPGGNPPSVVWTGAGLDPAKFRYTWSDDGRSLTAEYHGGLPGKTRVEWTLNPEGALTPLQNQTGTPLPFGIYQGKFDTAAQWPAENQPPNLVAVGSETVHEGDTLEISLRATDSDLPEQILTYSLVSGPTGLTVSGNGLLKWTPSESQGPSTNEVWVMVTDSGVPSMSSTNRFTVTVGEVNVAPTLTEIPLQMIDELVPWSLTLTATDTDVPANGMSFSLVSGPPGLTVSAAGLAEWTPTETQGPSTNRVEVRVIDGGQPVMSVTTEFLVIVRTTNSIPESLAKNLLIHYPFDGNGENQQTNGLHSAPAGNFRYEQGGKNGQALQIIGDNSILYSGGGFVSLPDLNDSIDQEFTLAVWGKGEDVGAMEHPFPEEAYIAFGALNLTRAEILLHKSQGVVKFLVDNGNQDGNEALIEYPIQLGEFSSRWKELVLTYRPGELAAYVDGALVGRTYATGKTFPVSNGTIGRHWWDGGASSSARLTAMIDDVRIFNRSLTESEVLLLHRIQTGGVPKQIITAVAAGQTHSVASKVDGTLWAWGDNQNGQLGDGTIIEKPRPVPIRSAINWETISASGSYTLALKTDGTLWAWGRILIGSFGEVPGVYGRIPMQIDSATNWKSVSAGDSHAAGIKRDGTLWAWGFNMDGQLGVGTRENHNKPVPVGSASDWKAVSAGYRHTLALKTDGTLWAWGGNEYGSLGDGSGGSKQVPIQIGSATNWQSVSAGPWYNVALMDDGTLWAWGRNNYGQLGDGTAILRSSPVQIGSATNWQTVAAGGDHTVASKTDGTLWAWGRNDYGQLGDGTAIQRNSPVQIDSATNWQTVSAGGDHTVASKTDGTLWAWGRNDYGQLGDGTAIQRNSPVLVHEVNQSPVMTVPDDQIIGEGIPMQLTLTSSDADLPPQERSYELVSGPAGMTVAPSGSLSWVPTESQGPSTNTVTVKVTDNGEPPLSGSASFTVVVWEVNQAPELTAPPIQFVDEGQSIGINLNGTDGDLPAQVLTYQLVSGPVGMALGSSGLLNWTPTDEQGPTTNVVRVELSDDGNPSLSATTEFTVIVREVNVPPVLAGPGDQSLDEGQTLTVNLQASDADVPKQTLSYALVSGPSGMTVSPTGVLDWTPAESQGPSTNQVIVVVVDSGSPSQLAIASFVVLVREGDSAPVLSALNDQTVDEGQTLTLTLNATDTDLPTQALSFSLVNGPAGLTVSPTGVLSWTPTEAQGPSTNLVTVRVIDDGLSPLSATTDFVIVVREVSSPPVLASVENQSVDEGQSLALTLAASDSDLPAQALSFGLVSGPAGMTVATNGVLSWTPGESHGGSSHNVTVQVSDDGNPSLASTTTFEVAVREVNSPPTLASVGPQSVIEGQLLSVTLLGTDTDLPAQSLGYRLVSGPAGLAVSAAGALSWIPTAAQSPGVYPVTVEVADDGEPSLVAVAEFEISVSEAPNLALRRVWQIGTDDDSDVLPYLPNGEFSRENERNDPPPGQVTLRPEDPDYVAGANPPADDDFYFAGLYAAGFNGLTADRTVTHDEPPVAWEWAQTLQDRTNRVHFVLEPDHVAADTTFRLTVEFPRGGSSVAGVVIPAFGTHPLEFRLRNSLGAEALLGFVLISGPTNIEFNFPASDIGATVGANTVEIVRTDVLPSNTSAWIFYDFLRIESFPPGSAPPMITQRPQGVTAGFGEAVVLTVKADSAVPPTYQWFRNKRSIPGATGASYLIPSLGVGDVGDYYVVVTNPNGSASSFPDNDVRVMLRGAFVIEAEDYNFGGGQTVEAASVMPLVAGLYEGKDGLQSIDFSIIEDTSDSGAGGNNLRNGWTNNGVVISALPGANADVTLDNEGGNTVRPDFVLTTNYKLGWSNPGEWFQYTRTFPPGRYSAVFIGAREGRAMNVMGRTLELVTGDGSQANAATTVIGELLADGTGGWSSHDWLPFLAPAGGTIAEFDLSGTQTLRLRHSVGDGDDDALLLYRLPSSVNLPPVLASVGDQFLDEGQTLSLSLVGSDSDLPVQELTYGLVTGPAGLTVSPTGVVSWTPTESQGPLTHTVLVQVTDSAEPPLSATNRFEVTVREVNQAPLLAAADTQSVKEGEALQLILSGSDGDLPAQTLTYALVSGPSGLLVTEAGLVTWVPTESQGPSTNSVTVRVVDNGEPQLSATATFTVIVQEVNTAPTLASPVTPTLEEGQALNLVLAGSDADLPVQALTFALESGPAGLTVSPVGVVSWIPTELQGGSTNEVTVRATDNGEPPLFVRTTFSVIVREVNQAPALTTPGNQDLSEGTALDLTLSGQDADLPAQLLTFGLISGPPGMVVSPSGALNWVPTESQGPSTNLVTIVVNDQGNPALSGTVSFTVIAREVNQAPQFPTLLEQTVNEGQGFALLLIGSDPDLPPQSLTYSLVDGPAGLTVGLNGLVNWAPSESQGPSTNDVTVRLTDSGVPPISTTNTLRVIVREVNTPPSMVAPANQVLDEGQAFTWDLQGTDGDLPPQELSYALIQAPLGMEITTQGAVTWTPNEPQGPSTNEVTIRLSDGGTPVLATTINFQLVVRENNRPPGWQNIPEQSVGEEQTLTLALAAGDPDLPYQTLTYSLLSGPPGLTIAALGELTWTPSESQGGSTNTVTIRVEDNGEPPLSATNELRIVVREINRAPVLPPLAEQAIVASVPWSLTLAGTDTDLPAQILTYTILSGPLGLSVTPGGDVTWTPSDAQAPSTNTITLRLSDDGQPPLATTTDFVVVVRPRDEIPELTLTVPETGGPMVLKIRGKNGQALVLENAAILGQWSEAQRLTGLGMDTPVQVILPSVLPDQIQFWRVRTGQ